jgi:GT2 family glycosyltransferase
VVKAIDLYGVSSEIMVVDNGSNDESIDYLESNFPQVRIAAIKVNLGFAAAMNMGIKETRGNIVIGLNNDVIVKENFIAPLLSHFPDDKNLFAVAAKMLLWDKKTLNFGRAKGDFRFGFFKRSLIDCPVTANTLYACAGAFAVDKHKFLELGGFDEDMDIYWEDLDLCYRAWKHGWKTIYEPQSLIYHKFHGTNLKKYGRNGIDALSGENYLLFVLKNIHDRTLLYRQLFFLPVLILASVLTGKAYFTKGLLRSFRRWLLFLKKRAIERQKAIFSDREVLSISAQ